MKIRFLWATSGTSLDTWSHVDTKSGRWRKAELVGELAQVVLEASL